MHTASVTDVRVLSRR